MSTVEYRCEFCGHRLFTESHSKIKYQCPNVGKELVGGGIHPETFVVQTQEYIGPNFQYKAEGEVDPTKTGVITPGVGGEGATLTIPVLVKSEHRELTPEEELEELRAFWFRLTGEKADGRLKNETLRREIEALEKSKADELEEIARQEAEAAEIALRETLRAELLEELKPQLMADLKAELLAQMKAEQEEREQGNGNSE